MLDLILDPLAYGFMQRGLVAAVLVGIVCAVMGAFVVLRGLAFIGDAVSHAAFPGLVIAYLLGIPLYIGGAVAAVGTALAIGAVARRGALRFDTAVGVLFAGTFAFGILLFSTIQNYVADLFSYLLGNVLGITFSDIIQIAILGGSRAADGRAPAQGAAVRVVRSGRAAASGLPVVTLDYLLLGLVGVTIVVSIQAVGIILVVAMLVTPAATGQLARRQVLGPGQDRHRRGGRRCRQRAVPELLPERRLGGVDRPGRDADASAWRCCSRRSRVGLSRRRARSTGDADPARLKPFRRR